MHDPRWNRGSILGTGSQCAGTLGQHFPEPAVLLRGTDDLHFAGLRHCRNGQYAQAGQGAGCAAGAVLRSAASGTQRQGVHRPDGYGSLSYHYLRGSPAPGAEVLREKSRQYLKFRCHRHVLFCHGDAGIFPGMRLVQRLQYRYL